MSSPNASNSWLRNVLAEMQEVIDRHLFALASSLVVVGAVLYVPQLASLWRKLPRVQDQGEQWLSALGFTLFVPLLLMFYLASWLTILRLHEKCMLVLLGVIGVPFVVIASPALADLAQREILHILRLPSEAVQPRYVAVLAWIAVPLLGSAYFLSWVVVLRWLGRNQLEQVRLSDGQESTPPTLQLGAMLPWNVFSETNSKACKWLLIAVTTLLLPVSAVNLLLLGLNWLMASLWVHLLDKFLVQKGRQKTLIVAGAAMAVVSICVYAYYHELFSPLCDSYPLSDELAGQLIFLPAVFGAWMVALGVFSRENTLSPTSRTTGRLLALVFSSLLFGEVLWIAAHFHEDFSYRLCSIWAMFHLIFLVVVACTWVDVCHLEWRMPVRQVALAVVAGLAIWGLSPTFLHRDHAATSKVAPPPLATPEGVNWYRQMEARLKHIGNDKQPVVLVAASGGGSRAALFTALVLEALANEPFPPGADAAAAKQTWADRVLLVSSVSGGSLASARFATGGADPAFNEGYVLRNSFSNEQARNTEADIVKLSKYYREIAEDRHGVPSLRDPNNSLTELSHRMLRRMRLRPFVDDMCTDYMAPLLRGVLSLSIDRGGSLQNFWEQKFDWKDHDNQKHDPGRPLLALNATSVRHGGRVVLGFPELPRRMFKLVLADEGSYDPSIPYTSSSSDLVAGYPLSLAQGVRASSNFPWGYPSGYLHRKLRLFKEVDKHEEKLPLDGAFNSLMARYDDNARALWEMLPRELNLIPELADLDKKKGSGKGKGMGMGKAEGVTPTPKLERRYLTHERLRAILQEFQLLVADPCAPANFRASALEILLEWDRNGWLAGAEQTEVALLDGGVNDNTGIPTLVEIVQHLESASTTNDPLVSQENRTSARNILKNLRDRGVIFVEIDSGAKPSDELQHELLTPLQGLSNATSAIASDERNRSIKRLNRLLEQPGTSGEGSGRGRSKEDNESTLLHCRFLCNHADEADVMTGWALGPDDKAHVIATFFWEYNAWKRRDVDLRYEAWRKARADDIKKDDPGSRSRLAELMRLEAQRRATQQRLILRSGKK